MTRLPPGEPLTVFISARVQEMAAERLAAGAVVARMRLRPVLFEHARPGATGRPVFLEAARSCDIFVGIYGLEYGDAVSGGKAPIEREFLETLQVPLMPRLLFSRAARGRQRKLQLFLQRAAPHGELLPFSDPSDFATRLKRALNVLLAVSYREIHSVAVPAAPRQSPGDSPGPVRD